MFEIMIKHRLPGNSRRGMLGVFINTFQYNTPRHMKAYDSVAVQANHHRISKLLQLKMQNSRHLAELYMQYPPSTYLHVWTHLNIMHFNKSVPLKLSIRFAARELQRDCAAASCSHKCNHPSTDGLTTESLRQEGTS